MRTRFRNSCGSDGSSCDERKGGRYLIAAGTLKGYRGEINRQNMKGTRIPLVPFMFFTFPPTCQV